MTGNSKRYRILAVDMDGTLLNDQSKITERTKAAIISAVDAGIMFVASSGRPMVALEEINALFDRNLPFITLNGAVVAMGKSKEILFSKALDADDIEEIYTLGISRDVPVVVWIDDRLFVSRDCESVRNYRRKSNADINIITDIVKLKDAGISKMLWIDTPDNIIRHQLEMGKYFGRRLHCHISSPDLLEFVNIEVSKGLALQKIGELFGISRDEIIAVGDSYNDISMLEYAGFSVAMENAPEEIKAICRYVTRSNNEDGVAEFIDRYLLHNSCAGI